MFRKLVGVAVLSQILVSSAFAEELSEAIRTVPLNEKGETITLSLKQVKNGNRLFNYACAQCHAGGVTNVNPDAGLGTEGLGTEALAGAVPNRNNIAGLVDYLNNPTTYDGKVQISELHPSTKSADIFAMMRNLTNEDLTAIAGHILLQPKILGKQWGGGK